MKKNSTFSKYDHILIDIIYFSIFHETVGQIAEYEKEVEEAARKMELIIRLSLSYKETNFLKPFLA